MRNLKTVKKFYDVAKVIDKNYHGSEHKKKISEALYIKVGLLPSKNFLFY